jgi:hypothetical protein
MPVIYESDEDKYYDKEELKIFKKGSQSGIESRGSGLFLPGTKHGNGLYLPGRTRDEGHGGEGLGGSGEGIIDSLISAGKAVIEGLSNNASTIGQAASAVGSVAGATSQVANAVKSVRDVSISGNSTKDLTEERKLQMEKIREKREQAEMRGKGFKIT